MFYSFCFILSLQVGAAILSTVFFTLAFLSLVVNLFSYKRDPYIDWPTPLVLVLIFVTFMMLSGLVMIMAAYNESRRQCFAAMAVLALSMAYWITLSAISFANKPTYIRRVCMVDRCAESFWLIDLKYRGDWRGTGKVETSNSSEAPESPKSMHRDMHYRSLVANAEGQKKSEDPGGNSGWEFQRFKPSKIERIIYLVDEERMNSVASKQYDEKGDTMPNNYYYNVLLNKLTNVSKHSYHLESNIMKREINDSSDDKSDDGYDVYGNYDDDEDEEEVLPDGETKYELGPQMAAVAVLFGTNLVYFLFAIIIMWSYAEELAYNFALDDEEV